MENIAQIKMEASVLESFSEEMKRDFWRKNLPYLREKLARKKEEMNRKKPAGTWEGGLPIYMNWINNGKDKSLTLFITSMIKWKVGETVDRLVLYAWLDPEMIPAKLPVRLPKLHVAIWATKWDPELAELERKVLEYRKVSKEEKSKAQEIMESVDTLLLCGKDRTDFFMGETGKKTPVLSCQLPDDLKQAIGERIRRSIDWDMQRKKKRLVEAEEKGEKGDGNEGCLVFSRIKEDFCPEDLEIDFQELDESVDFYRDQGMDVDGLHKLEKEIEELDRLVKAISKKWNEK